LILIFLQFNLENPAWLIGQLSDRTQTLSSIVFPGGGDRVLIHFGVLSALGFSMIIWALLLRLKPSLILAVSAASILLTQILIPAAENVETLYSPFLRIFLIPGRTGIMQVLYPFIPWLGFTGLGIVLVKNLTQDRKSALRWSLRGGAILLILFVVIRALGSFGNFHPSQDSSLLSFLSLTKYPPSLTFALLTLGLNAFLFYFCVKFESGLNKWGRPLLVFGQTALFFYIAHLFLFAFIGLAFPTGAGYGWTYVIWIGGTAALYPLCLWYRGFKKEKPPNSVWRFF
jgi:uncharacterized membrane protein